MLFTDGAMAVSGFPKSKYSTACGNCSRIRFSYAKSTKTVTSLSYKAYPSLSYLLMSFCKRVIAT